MIKKNDIITLEITDISSDGNGVGKHENMAVFVPMTAVGDICKVKILKVLSSYCFGKVEEIVTPSADRTENLCPNFVKCGGCDFLHITYDAEKAAKKNIIIVCPSTLLATLKIINKTWQNKIQAENLSQILMSAASVYDKLRIFIEKLENIDTKFNSLHKAFLDLFASAKGRNGFVQQVANLSQLGISTNKKIDEKYLSETEEVEVEIE